MSGAECWSGHDAQVSDRSSCAVCLGEDSGWSSELMDLVPQHPSRMTLLPNKTIVNVHPSIEKVIFLLREGPCSELWMEHALCKAILLVPIWG